MPSIDSTLFFRDYFFELHAQNLPLLAFSSRYDTTINHLATRVTSSIHSCNLIAAM